MPNWLELWFLSWILQTLRIVVSWLQRRKFVVPKATFSIFVHFFLVVILTQLTLAMTSSWLDCFYFSRKVNHLDVQLQYRDDEVRKRNILTNHPNYQFVAMNSSQFPTTERNQNVPHAHTFPCSGKHLDRQLRNACRKISAFMMSRIFCSWAILFSKTMSRQSFNFRGS